MEQNTEELEQQEQCKVCGKFYKTVNMVHVRTHGMNMDQYALMSEYKDREIPLPEPTKPVSKEQRTKNIFGEGKTGADAPLSEFLTEFNMTEPELRELARYYTTGQRIDPRISTDNKKKIGAKRASEYADLDSCTVTNLHLAEELVTNYGFVCTNLIGRKGNTPKTWVLEKQ